MSLKDDYMCPVCLEIVENPVSTPCSHVFCRSCLDGVISAVASSGEKPCCPQCRERFSPEAVKSRPDISTKVSQLKDKCDACGKEMMLKEMRTHNIRCKSLKELAKSSQFPSSKHDPTPNRSTFTCPYCKAKNLDNKGLVKHCNDKHSSSFERVVCPICASMPWGDPTMKSSNFIQHLNNRHIFEYDTYVDYGQDDDAMLAHAMQLSLTDN